MSILRSILLVHLVVLPIGCGDDGGTGPATGIDAPGVTAGACDTRHCNAINEIFTCFQWSGQDAFNRDLCAQYGGTIGEGACPTSSQVAGCRSENEDGSGCAIIWGYPPLTAENVREGCSGNGDTFINR